MTSPRKKLIEVSLPLDAINKASEHEKAISVGHPSTLHLWWARRPLATCRAVLLSLLLDDPSSWPNEFPTEQDQQRERKRLHKIIERVVPWNATKNENALSDARYEIVKSIARERGDRLPDRGDTATIQSYLTKYAPPVCDPFCGGGSIPLEACRLGLRSRGSDLNPVAVLISKATCEISNAFVDFSPVNPDRDLNMKWRGLEGLAEDVQWYGKWIRDEAHNKIGHLYPQILVTEEMSVNRADLVPYIGKMTNVIAWHWARTVASPNPKLKGLHVPLASTFVLSSKPGAEAIIVPKRNLEKMTYDFSVQASNILDADLSLAKIGTKGARGANFSCLVSGATMDGDYIKEEGVAGRIGTKLMAISAEGYRERLYFSPTDSMEQIALSADPKWRPEYDISGSTQYVGVRPYGISRFDQLFTDRQIVALTTLSDLVSEARERVLSDALLAGMTDDSSRLFDGGIGACAYADAVATYLGLCVSRQANRLSNLCLWYSGGQKVQHVFARQTLPIVWDFCEANPFSESTGSFISQLRYLVGVIKSGIPTNGSAAVIQQDAADASPLLNRALVVTDPPYYDNIPYADISDFFYVWQRRSLCKVWPELFRRVLTPKDNELVAFSYRHENKEAAEKFFMNGIGNAFRNIYDTGTDKYPVAIYYAFKQSVEASEGLTSPGWAAFLQGLVDVGYTIEGTWPMRTENAISLKKKMNALASSIVLVCRKRPADAPVITRSEFKAQLLKSLPNSIRRIHDGDIKPVDIAQVVLGLGMGIFTAASKVIESDDTPMTVRQAIALINQVRDEIYGNESADYDGETRFCIEWFGEYGWSSGRPDDAEKLARPNGIGIGNLESAGVFFTRMGVVQLVQRDEMPEDWNPNADKHPTDWECAQHLVRTLKSPSGGIEAAGHLYSSMTQRQRDAARKLAFRLYDLCERNSMASEAQEWNMLVQEWPAIESAAADTQNKSKPLL